MSNYHVPGPKITIFNIEISPTPNKTRKIIEWYYSVSNGHFFADTLDSAIIHIIAVKNNREDMAKAAALLLDVNRYPERLK
jgi:hypothetical protein